MKSKIILILLSSALLSCAGSHDEQSDQLSVEKSGPPATEEYESGSSPTVSEEYAETDMDQVKMEREKSVSEGQNYLKKPPTLKQSLENLSDTIYLKNVRLSKKFIKTAELRFKVKQVESATHKIENMALSLGGFIQQSQIKSNYVTGRTVEISTDSMLTVFEYYIDNHLTIRVPNIYFDSVLNELAKIYIYLDHRDVKTEDVSTTFLRNKLKAEKNAEYEKRIQKASDTGNRKLDDIVEAERTASELADQAIDKKIENYQLQDRIDFSTISMTIYQANAIHEEIGQNTKLYEYQPDFWQKAWEAVRTGWNVILTVIIGLIYLWPLYVLAILVYVGIKYFRKKFRK